MSFVVLAIAGNPSGRSTFLLHRSKRHMSDAMEPTSSEERPAASPAVVLEGIVKRQALVATYNREEITIAPHVLYTRHGDLHVDAVTLDRGGRPPREMKLGTFRLSGLGALRVTPRRFDPSPLFRSEDKRYAGVVLLAV